MTCPICATRASDPKYRPFCSRRCADIDLGRWLNESYRVPVTEPEDTDTLARDTPPERTQ